MLDDITYYITLYEQRSFKKAATILNMKASTLSYHITNLEDKLEKKLITRTSKMFQPTPFGEYIYSKFKYLPDFVDSTLTKYNDSDENVSQGKGTINIALSESISSKLILPHLGNFTKKNPNINLNISMLSNITKWPANHIDIVLSVKFIDGDDFANRFIRREYVQLYCSTKYAAEYGLPKSINELDSHKLVGAIDDKLMALEYVNMYNISTQKEHVLELKNNSLNINNAIFQNIIGVHLDYIFCSFNSLMYEHIQNGDIINVLPNWSIYELNFHIVSRKVISNEEQALITFISNCLRLD